MHLTNSCTKLLLHLWVALFHPKYYHWHHFNTNIYHYTSWILSVICEKRIEYNCRECCQAWVRIYQASRWKPAKKLVKICPKFSSQLTNTNTCFLPVYAQIVEKNRKQSVKFNRKLHLIYSQIFWGLFVLVFFLTSWIPVATVQCQFFKTEW